MVEMDSNIGVPFSKDLRLDASSAYIINGGQSELTFEWVCPTEFNCSGIELR